MVLITGRHRSAAFVDPFSKLLGRIVDRGSIVPAETIVNTASEQEVYDEVLRLLQLAVRRHTGEEAADAVIASLLGLVRIAVLDPDRRDRGNILALLKTAVLQDPTDGERTWLELVSECQRLAEN